MDDRELRDLKADIADLREKFVPVSEERLHKQWRIVRETLDDFTQRLVAQELARQGHNDTLAKLLAQQRQNEVVMQAQTTQIRDMQEQLNTIAVRLSEMIAEAE